ncbi:asparagine synthetase B family protein [Citrobacter sp. JGM124]|uniref:asparagine synthase family protein n=1 Tax=Citrobacter sp. JGM124 TaxID=2799789 RepID=UPI001BA6A3E9|nr:asparagine synthetase B family protein [Citrobacter sp. JGM124]MBS0847415.1 asparagine synthase [Citrobacter sp. JGM124]
MSNAFCFIHHCSDAILSNVGKHFTVTPLTTGMLLLKGDTNITQYFNERYTAYLIGNIYNQMMLRTLVANSDSQVWAMNDAELFCLIRKTLGNTALALAEGDFCLFIEHHNGTIEIITETRGLNSISLVQTQHHWITNSLKIVGQIAGADAFSFRPEKEVIDNIHRADNFSPVSNITRLKPGTITRVMHDEQHHLYIENQYLTSLSSHNILTLPENTLYQLIDQHLRGAISSWPDINASIGIPLSGGVDSSLITALACQQFSSVKTWSIGSEQRNEFIFAEIVAETLGTDHEIKILTDDDIISGIAEAIYHNEIFDGLSSEVQSGLFNVYKLASGKVSSLLTGYGADLLFGGIINPENPPSDPNAILAQQIYRTKWTNEFSTHGANHYGLNVYHPFWCNNMLSLCRNLSPHFKVRNNEVKNVLREYTANLNKLPIDIIWRKKRGIHEGSAVNQAFANFISTQTNNYQEKTRFSYTLYKAFLTGSLIPEDLSIDKLRGLLKRSA